MKAKIILTAVLGSFILFSFSGCQYLKKRVGKTEKIEYKLNASGKTRIEIDNSNGNVEVMVTNDTLNIIYVTAEKTGKVKINEADKPIEGVDIHIDSSGSVIKIDTDYRHSSSFFGEKTRTKVNYIVKVPAKFQVYVSLTNGNINAHNLISDSRFENENGSIYLSNCSGNISVETVNGSIKANVDSTKGINAETVNGSITLGNLKFVNASIDANCTNGRVKYDNLNFSSLIAEKRNLSGTLGAGNNTIKLSTVNGSIKLDGNFISYNKKEHVNFDLKWEFDENDDNVKIKVEDTDDKQGMKENTKDTNRAKDSSKAK